MPQIGHNQKNNISLIMAVRYERCPNIMSICCARCLCWHKFARTFQY